MLGTGPNSGSECYHHLEFHQMLFMLILYYFLLSGQVTALQGFVAVDGQVFNWAGAASGPSLATETSAVYTSTKTVFTYDIASKVTLTVTFLSPVYPNDLVKQSLQYSYIDVSAVASDGSSHDVQIYLDCTGGMSLYIPYILLYTHLKPFSSLTRASFSFVFFRMGKWW